MSLTGVKVYAPLFDLSGYGEWSRAYVKALIAAGVPVTVSSATFKADGRSSFDPALRLLGPSADLLEQHIDLPIAYDKVIAWLTPPLAARYTEGEKKAERILMTLWETDRIPASWAEAVCSFDQLWLPGEWNRHVFASSLSRTRVKPPRTNLVSFPLEPPPESPAIELEHPQTGEVLDSSTFIFYTVSQWSERKNFQALLKAYWQSFSVEDKVVLLLKTWRGSLAAEEFMRIEADILGLARALQVRNPAAVGIVRPELSDSLLWSFHRRCDCYVTTSHGEGLGLGLLAAAAVGNPVVTHLFGEQASFAGPENAFVYDHSLVEVPPLPGGCYGPPQRWAEPAFESLCRELQAVRSDREKAAAVGRRLQQTVLERHNAQAAVHELLTLLGAREQ